MLFLFNFDFCLIYTLEGKIILVIQKTWWNNNTSPAKNRRDWILLSIVFSEIFMKITFESRSAEYTTEQTVTVCVCVWGREGAPQTMEPLQLSQIHPWIGPKSIEVLANVRYISRDYKWHNGQVKQIGLTDIFLPSSFQIV